MQLSLPLPHGLPTPASPQARYSLEVFILISKLIQKKNFYSHIFIIKKVISRLLQLQSSLLRSESCVVRACLAAF